MPSIQRLIPRPSASQLKWLSKALRNETTGGVLLLAAAILALAWANFNFDSFNAIRSFRVGPSGLHLDLSLGQWATDGLLVIFFFVAGLELKHELVVGSLKNASVAVVPVAAALGGMIAPALIFTALNAGKETAIGWGIPMATDIAFALAVLAVAGRRLPIEIRAFLLTLAVVDDLGAIIVIAIFYTDKLNLVALTVALLCLVIFALLQRFQITGWYLYLPLAIVIWYSTHESGIHATIAGVAMGLCMNLKKADSVMRVVHPISAAVVVPIFAFFASGVLISSANISDIFSSPLAMGIILGLVVGKPLGVVSISWLVAKFTRAELSQSISWWDVVTIGFLAGVGFTVSLLINALAMTGSESASLGTMSVLIASSLAAIISIVALQFRKRAYAKR